MELSVETKNDIKINYNSFFYATMCHVCKQFGDGVRLKKCSGCRMISYCGKEHQKQHWPQHEPLCKAIRHVLQNHSLENDGVTLEDWNSMKLNLMLLVSCRLGRRLKLYEREMFKYPRECAVCYKRDSHLLEDCQKCMSVSFCKDHKDNIKHEDACVSLELCLRSNLSTVSEETYHPDMHYLQHISDTDTFQDIFHMDDFINIHGHIQTLLKIPYKVLAAEHSQYLTRPLTLFNAMLILDYVPKRKDLVIHVIGANFIEETNIIVWEVLLHLIRTITSLVVIMIGPELKSKSNLLSICNNCMSQKKEVSLEFHNALYKDYVCSSLFVKPDLVVGFNAGIYEQEFAATGDTWAPSIQVLAKQDYPFVLTCYMREELEKEIDRINIILDRKVEYLYRGKNPFASLRPYRALNSEQVFYENHYIIIYRSLYNNLEESL